MAEMINSDLGGKALEITGMTKFLWVDTKPPKVTMFHAPLNHIVCLISKTLHWATAAHAYAIVILLLILNIVSRNC